MARTGNRDALAGIRELGARELCEELDEKFQKTGRVILLDYYDPDERMSEYLETTANFRGFEEINAEQMIRLFGADNLSELRETPRRLLEHIERISAEVPEPFRQQLLQAAKLTSEQSATTIEQHLSERIDLEKVRRAFGLTSQDRKRIEEAENPIEEAWLSMRVDRSTIRKDQFFSKEPYTFSQHLDHSQASSIAGTHAVLNMLGLWPDKGLKKREKVGNISSDGQHIGLASYCQAFVTADQRSALKAQAIYAYWDIPTQVILLPYTGSISKFEITVDTNNRVIVAY